MGFFKGSSVQALHDMPKGQDAQRKHQIDERNEMKILTGIKDAMLEVLDNFDPFNLFQFI